MKWLQQLAIVIRIRDGEEVAIGFENPVARVKLQLPFRVLRKRFGGHLHRGREA